MSDRLPIPADDLTRPLVAVTADAVPQHIGIVGNPYTVLLRGADTAGRFCLIDRHIPANGGRRTHRHDFEETFTLLEGELVATFRGQKQTVRAGETIHIPANAPHPFHKASDAPVRLLCLCSPAGQQNMFLELGVLVPTRTTPPPPSKPKQPSSPRSTARSCYSTPETLHLPWLPPLVILEGNQLQPLPLPLPLPLP